MVDLLEGCSAARVKYDRLAPCGGMVLGQAVASWTAMHRSSLHVTTLTDVEAWKCTYQFNAPGRIAGWVSVGFHKLLLTRSTVNLMN
jgi:hypothetical protein